MQLHATSTPLGEDFWIFFDLPEFGRFGAVERIFGRQSQNVRFSGRAEGRSSVIRPVGPDSEKLIRILGRARVRQNNVL